MALIRLQETGTGLAACDRVGDLRDLGYRRFRRSGTVRHLMEAEGASRRYARVWTTFDRLLADWQTVAAKISHVLRIVWPNPPELAGSEIEGFLEPSLRHFKIERNTVPSSVGELACRLWQATQCGVAADETALRAEFDIIRMVDCDLTRLECRHQKAPRSHQTAPSSG